MSQISVHNDSGLATIHSSSVGAVNEAVKHLSAVLRLLQPPDQLRMMVRLESLLTRDDHVRYLAVISSKVPVISSPHALSPTDGSEEFCIFGVDVPIAPGKVSYAPSSSLSQSQQSSPSTSPAAPASPQRAQRSHSTVSPEQHQGIGSRIASRTRKFLTLPKQRVHLKNPNLLGNTAPRMTKRPSISSSIVKKLDELPEENEENQAKIHLGLVLLITADLKITLDGDGGFRVDSRDHHHVFKPVSVQAMWSVLQTLLKASENARKYFQLSPGLSSPQRLSTYSLSSVSCVTTSLSTSSYAGSIKSNLHIQTEGNLAVLTSESSLAPGEGNEKVSWVEKYARQIDSMWVKEWHLILEDVLTLTAGGHGERGESQKRPLSPLMSRHRQQVYTPTELKIRQQLRDVMLSLDLEQVNSKEIRQRVEDALKMDLTAYKSFIDHEILVILGQMDSASEILDHLYLGSEWNAGNLEELRSRRIGLVLNVTTEINNFFPHILDYKNIRVNDTEEEDMLHHWDEACRYISEAKKEGKNVLVHCKMGVSRSASVVIAYIMKANDWDLQQAMQFVKAKRSCIQPNPGFMHQLEVFQGILQANKYRSSWQQSASSGSTLSLNDVRSPRLSCSELDDLHMSKLRRTASEFFSSPSLSCSTPQRSESMRVSSPSSSSSKSDDLFSPSAQQPVRSKKERKKIQCEAIIENIPREEPDDTLGMFRALHISTATPEGKSWQSKMFSIGEPPSEPLTNASSAAIIEKRKVWATISQQSASTELKSSKTHSSGCKSVSEHFSSIRSSFSSTTIPKTKMRQSRQSVLSSLPFNMASPSPPVKEHKVCASRIRPASIHGSSYLKPKEPVQTLVKYFDELNHSPHPTAMAAQAAQV